MEPEERHGGWTDEQACATLETHFAAVDHITVLARGPSATEPWAKTLPRDVVIVADPTYATRDVFQDDPTAVLIGDNPRALPQMAARWRTSPPSARPLLAFCYLSRFAVPPFEHMNLPPPVPILPLLVREGLYERRADQPYPTTGVFLVLLAVALKKEVYVAGIDLYRHPTGKVYVNAKPSTPPEELWPKHHSESCDMAHLQLAALNAGSRLHLNPPLRARLDRQSQPAS
jgi:hypothetical protein